MYNLNSNDEKQLLMQKSEVLEMHKDISFKHKQIKELISDLHYEVSKKEILLEDKTIEESQKSILKYEFALSKRELERAVQEKELLNKDLHILQHRIKHLENEIYKSKPWWSRIFKPVQ